MTLRKDPTIEKVSKTIAVRCTPSQHELATKQANREGRSVSNYMVQLLLRAEANNLVNEALEGK